MASSKKWYLLCYDIHDEKRLRRIAKLVKGYGVRVQYSVFRARLSARQLERFRWEATKIMKTEDDLLVVELCEKCVGKLASRHKKLEWPTETKRYAIV